MTQKDHSDRHTESEANVQRESLTGDSVVIRLPRWLVQMLISGSCSSLVTIGLHLVFYR